MNKFILKSQSTQVKGNKLIITEETETSISLLEIQEKLLDIDRQKSRLREQGNLLIEKFNKLTEEEDTLKDYLEQIDNDDFPIIR
ncbi:MAG: hypothetical protein M0Q14_10690 [Tissierellaceae bacterium]|nr:hypothetical protein [Tissierellaceae bacterium]